MAKSKQTVKVDGGRYEISSSGYFNAPYRYDPMLKMIVLGAGIGFVVLVAFVTIKVLRDILESMPDVGVHPDMFPAMVAAMVIFIAAILAIVICGVTVKYISTGFRCSYAANNDKMILDYGKTKFTIFYEDVDMVNFSPRSFMGKINGYDVTVRMNSEVLQFSVTSDAYISPKSTPFFIIKEQMEKVRYSKVDPNAKDRTQREIALGIGSGRAISQEEIQRAKNRRNSVYDRLNDLLSEGAPSIEESENSEQAYGYVSPFEGKVSPTAEGFAGDMPKTSSMFADQPHEIVQEGGTRETDLYDIIKMGSFHVAPNKREKIISLVLWGVIGLIVGIIPAYIPSYYVTLYFANVGLVLFLGIDIGIGVWFFLHGLKHQHGKEYKYRADGRCMKITSRKMPDEEIVYNEVKGISYTLKTLLGKPYALNVSIVTKYRTVNYCYMYPRFGKELRESELPFAVIKDNMPEQNS